MTERFWRNVFIIGSVLCLIALAALSIQSLNQVVTTQTAPVTAQVAAGKLAWQQRDCNDCHTILGIGGYYAPDLTKVIDRRGATWIAAWLKDPKSVKPNALMPNQNLTASQIDDIVAFLTWVGKVNTNGWPPKPITNLGGSSVPTGDVLFQQKGCSACHMVNNQGALGPGPNLSHIASQPYDSLSNTPDFLAKWLQDPAAQKAGTAMPNLNLTQPEINSLVLYLSGLK